MPRFWRKKGILAKIESSYGTDPTPTGSANAIVTSDFSITPLEGRDLDRGLDQVYLGAQGQVVVDEQVKIDFSVEVAGAGAAGTVPGYGPLLRACGLAQAITADTDVQYEPVSGSFESVYFYVNLDGVLHKAKGVRGNVKVSLKASDIPHFQFSFIGLLGAISDTALPTLTTTIFQQVIPVNKANTTFSLHSYSAVMEDLQLDLGQKVEPRFLVNSEGVIISDRMGSGSCVIEAPSIATKDFFTLARSKARAALQCVHGTVAGNIVQFDAPAVEIGRPTYGQTQGITNLSIPLTLIPTTDGDDELKITVK